MAAPRMTPQTTAVLAVLLEADPEGELYGLEILAGARLQAGTIYPILTRLAAAGWVSGRWEDTDAAVADGRPPRRYYRLTVEGRARAVHASQARGRVRTGLLGVRPDRAGAAG
jgi:PadR family transcriptional regulator, regulatory protein PadR